ncbi:hypothetical protein C8E03_11475 [Lachnotalea glycerini]|uniref:BIG2 domain-containing protein n=1 Tax=Lachnotalea glycerini TaxID=1763509 RepID=A0A255IN33_9FIRM|nr:hypothetical protein [Lachnotalea glycerini]PXV85996.1 hypothetical protein C8E03_11475 [Lachnotalea glycerini]RDY31426.1 hypothetical protein CG710_009935 [Lachnotalea glycerini]
MTKFSFKKIVSAIAISMSLALTVPSVLPIVTSVTTVEAASPSLNTTSTTLRAGEVIKLKVRNKGKKSVTWSTNKKKVVTVKNGLVTAVGKGSAVITAKVGNKKLKCRITVTENSYSIDANAINNKLNSGYVYFIPKNVYYKNGKLYCKTVLYNRKFTSNIKRILDKKGNTISKLNVSLTATTFATSYNTNDVNTVIASGKVKNTLPKNIGYNKSKTFTIEFSASQIKKKGFDLSKTDFITLNIKNDLYAY